MLKLYFPSPIVCKLFFQLLASQPSSQPLITTPKTLLFQGVPGDRIPKHAFSEDFLQKRPAIQKRRELEAELHSGEPEFTVEHHEGRRLAVPYHPKQEAHKQELRREGAYMRVRPLSEEEKAEEQSRPHRPNPVLNLNRTGNPKPN